MTDRATVQRDSATGADGFGQPNVPTWAVHLASLPCWYFTPGEREVVDGNKTATLARHRMLVPVGTDIAEKDRVTFIKDRLGANRIANTMKIHAVMARRGHIACDLVEVAA